MFRQAPNPNQYNIVKAGLIKIAGALAAWCGFGGKIAAKLGAPKPPRNYEEYFKGNAPRHRPTEKKISAKIRRERKERRELIKEASCMGAYEHKMKMIREGKGKNGKSMSAALLKLHLDNTL
jgi:hypothetical protein